MSRGEALGTKIERNGRAAGLATSPVSTAELWRRRNGSELDNATLPVLDNGNGGDDEVEVALVEL